MQDLAGKQAACIAGQAFPDKTAQTPNETGARKCEGKRRPCNSTLTDRARNPPACASQDLVQVYRGNTSAVAVEPPS
ncbi:MAG: hypothetical protein OJF47_001215 [Nitrospira sp.]|nr:MAG: hypothetical protein OJF47_001215 [Nitrospira sp.]